MYCHREEWSNPCSGFKGKWTLPCPSIFARLGMLPWDQLSKLLHLVPQTRKRACAPPYFTITLTNLIYGFGKCIGWASAQTQWLHMNLHFTHFICSHIHCVFAQLSYWRLFFCWCWWSLLEKGLMILMTILWRPLRIMLYSQLIRRLIQTLIQTFRPQQASNTASQSKETLTFSFRENMCDNKGLCVLFLRTCVYACVWMPCLWWMQLIIPL